MRGNSQDDIERNKIRREIEELGKPVIWQQSEKVELVAGAPRIPETLWREDLLCHATGMSYDFGAKTGRIDLPASNCPQGLSVVEFFKKIDPDVRRIYAVSDSPEFCMKYLRKDIGWNAIRPFRPWATEQK